MNKIPIYNLLTNLLNSFICMYIFANYYYVILILLKCNRNAHFELIVILLRIFILYSVLTIE